MTQKLPKRTARLHHGTTDPHCITPDDAVSGLEHSQSGPSANRDLFEADSFESALNEKKPGQKASKRKPFERMQDLPRYRTSAGSSSNDSVEEDDEIIFEKTAAKRTPRKVSSTETRRAKPKRERKYRLRPRVSATLVMIALGCVLVFGVMLGSRLSLKSVTNITSTTLKNTLVEAQDLVSSYNYYSGIGKIENYQQLSDWNIPFTGKRLLYTYQGKVSLGFNTSDIDVKIHGNVIDVTCPPVQILSNEIDPDSIEVYDESNNIFNPLKADDIFDNLNLEMRKQEEALKTNGILADAKEAAKNAVRQLVAASTGSVGDYTIQVSIPDADLASPGMNSDSSAASSNSSASDSETASQSSENMNSDILSDDWAADTMEQDSSVPSYAAE